MERHIPHDYATSNVLAWTASQSANVEPSVEEDAGADADEPPDCRSPTPSNLNHFKRAPVRRGSEHHESLLTRALQSHSDDDAGEAVSLPRTRRRRSITSNFSLSSATDMTCSTGFTTPARTSSPSPRLAEVGFVPLATNAGRTVATTKPLDTRTTTLAGTTQPVKDPAIQALEKKRCISFACAAKPKTDDKALMPPPPKPTESKDTASKKNTIKFACPSQVPSRSDAPQRRDSVATTPVAQPALLGISTQSTPRSSSKGRSPRLARKLSQSPAPARTKKWLTADSKDLESECSRFHEFASGERQEHDWILRDGEVLKPRITVNDTLQRENEIRKLGKEAEEEADEEEAAENDLEGDEDDEDESPDGDDGDNADDGLDEEDENVEEEEADGDDIDSKYAWDDEASDGYKTDSEIGFADSDEEDDGLVLWTALGEGHRSLSGATTIYRRPSVGEHSDSSDCAKQTARARRRERRVKIRPSTPELPDSTDFVCGTLDEDRPLEEAYISMLAARKQGKQQLIPQDIDPSFPTSDPEDEAEDLYKKGHGESDDHLWLHGELEDIHHERDRKARRRKADQNSPKRMRSPPPKRLHSPPPKARGRSPRRLFEQPSPRRFRSPAPNRGVYKSPLASPVQSDQSIAFKSLAFRPGLTYTKSLPKGPILFPHLKSSRRSRASTITAKATHVRGAIDIVTGLEQKRQRRKEKFYQKYCRARKEKGQPRRPPPGQGAERMREVGLIMAGKIGQGNFVLSI
ncbi:hypothetical protein OQA88_409 [Cercophora sp. LCS_1]